MKTATPATPIGWQTLTAGSLFTGYAGYYICRSNLSVCSNSLIDDGLSTEWIGLIGTAGVGMYALGKITNGLTADFIGGRRMFLVGIFASVACTVAFGLAGGGLALLLIWGLNRYVQSMGWVALIKVSSRWFPVGLQATVLGIISMSYLLGDAFARAYLGSFIAWGADWRVVFFISAVSLGAIGVFCLLTLKSSPADVGAAEPSTHVRNVYGAAGEQNRPSDIGTLLLPLLSSVSFWLVCLINFGLTLIRESFNLWTPVILYQVAGLSQGNAAISSLLFPLVGAGSAFLAGASADLLRGRYAYVLFPSILLLTIALLATAVVPMRDRPLLALALICCVSFFLLAPYSFLSGVIALELGGKRGSSSAAGLIDSAGYVGGMASGYVVGLIASRDRWEGAFMFLAVVAGLTLVAAGGYLLWQEIARWRLRKQAP